MSADAVVHWVSDLRYAAEREENATQRILLHALETQARGKWLRHIHTPESLVTYFAEMMQLCGKADFPSLLYTARRLHAGLSETVAFLQSGERKNSLEILASLNENPYGRFFESLLMEEIITHPSEGMRRAASDWGMFIFEMLREKTYEIRMDVLTNTKKRFIQRWSARQMHGSSLHDFLDDSRCDFSTMEADALRCLRECRHPKYGLLPYIDLITNMEHYCEETYEKEIPWMAASVQYFEVIEAVRSREQGEFPRTKTSNAGITFSYQEGISRKEVRTARAIDFLAGLRLAQVNQPAKHALLHGHPFVCGVSTHTMRLLHAFAWAKGKVDPSYMLLNYMGHLVDIGAHSMQETLWIAYQLDQPLSLGLGNFWTQAQRERVLSNEANSRYQAFMTSGNSHERDAARAALIEDAMNSDFVADIEQVFRAFTHDEETSRVIAAAVRTAWNATIDLYRSSTSKTVHGPWEWERASSSFPQQRIKGLA